MPGLPGGAPPDTLQPLREELLLHEGPCAPDGSPTWVLEDPGAARFVQLGWVQIEMLRRWGLGSAQKVADLVAKETVLTPSVQAVQKFAAFLGRMGFLGGVGEEGAAKRLEKVCQNKPKTTWWKFLLHHYLFFRIPLVQPDVFLTRTVGVVARIFFTRTFLWLTVLAAIVGLLMVVQQWDTFQHTFLHFFSWEGALAAGVTLACTKVIHELGHAYAAKYFGCHVPTMGLAFLVMMPLLYTDTSGAWRLKSHRQRMAVAAAGVAAEMSLAAWATLAWNFLPEGTGKSAAFFLATTAWIMTVVVNSSPFMRFDGYYLASDFLGVANLHQRSFALAKWQLRRWFLGITDPPPEHFPARLHRILFFYAISTWIYRLVVFTGIALLVYHAFFKILGIVLFLVEISVFLMLPILKEGWAWGKILWERKADRRALWIPALFTILLGLFFIPWSGKIEAPALLQPQKTATLYAPAGAQVSAWHLSEHQSVAAGEILAQLYSPDLTHQLTSLREQDEELSWQEAFLRMRRETGSGAVKAGKERTALAARISDLAERQARLTVRAPFAGRVLWRAYPLALGEWVAEGEKLAVIGGDGPAQAQAYVLETDLTRFAEGAQATFYPEDTQRSPVPLTVTSIATGAVDTLADAPELASPLGGAIAARQAPAALQRKLGASETLWVPDDARYRVRLAAVTQPEAQVLRGTVVIEGERESYAGRFVRYAASVLLREAGF